MLFKVLCGFIDDENRWTSAINYIATLISKGLEYTYESAMYNIYVFVPEKGVLWMI